MGFLKKTGKRPSEGMLKEQLESKGENVNSLEDVS